MDACETKANASQCQRTYYVYSGWLAFGQRWLEVERAMGIEKCRSGTTDHLKSEGYEIA